MSYSELFDVTLGVKQGEPLSPLLFILFINDVKDCIDNNNLTENDMRLLSIYMLLFADDIALFTTNPESLLLQLNAIYDYSCKWGLKINVKNTKICIFEKEKSNCLFRWNINNENVEKVDEFCNLGMKFYYTTRRREESPHRTLNVFSSPLGARRGFFSRTYRDNGRNLD